MEDWKKKLEERKATKSEATLPNATTSSVPKGNPFLQKIATPQTNTTPAVAKPLSTTPAPNNSATSSNIPKANPFLQKVQQSEPKQTTPTSLSSSQVSAKTKRMTQRQTQRISIHVGNTLDNVIKQIGGLDARLRAAEAAKIQAEDKLMEIAIAKLEVDEVMNKVDIVLKRIIDQIDKFNNQQIKEMLIKLRTQTMSNEGEHGNARFSIIVPSDGIGIGNVPEPPAVPSLTPLPPSAPPPPVIHLPTQAPSLLDSIRKGIPLRNINVEKLKEEQKKFRVDAKSKLDSMKSLEDTLRDALTERMIDMNLYEGEEEEDDGLWDEV